jgi:hypothetical protein
LINVDLQLLLTDTEILDRNEICATDCYLTGAGREYQRATAILDWMAEN